MDNNQAPKIDVKYVGDSMNFIALFSNGKMIGQPILLSHYHALYREHDCGTLNEFLASMTPQEWDLMHLSSILDWRNHGLTR